MLESFCLSRFEFISTKWRNEMGKINNFKFLHLTSAIKSRALVVKGEPEEFLFNHVVCFLRARRYQTTEIAIKMRRQKIKRAPRIRNWNYIRRSRNGNDKKHQQAVDLHNKIKGKSSRISTMKTVFFFDSAFARKNSALSACVCVADFSSLLPPFSLSTL